MIIRYVPVCDCGLGRARAQVTHHSDLDSDNVMVSDLYYVCDKCGKRYIEVDQMSYDRAVSSLAGKGYDRPEIDNIIRGLMMPPSEVVGYVNAALKNIEETIQAEVRKGTSHIQAATANAEAALKMLAPKTFERAGTVEWECMSCGTKHGEPMYDVDYLNRMSDALFRNGSRRIIMDRVCVSCGSTRPHIMRYIFRGPD